MALGVIISIIAYSLVFSVIIFYPLYTEMSTASSIPELIRASSIATFLHKTFWPGVFAVALMAGIHILFFSHRTVGPIYRFEKQLKALKGGDYSSRIHLRKKDEFEFHAFEGRDSNFYNLNMDPVSFEAALNHIDRFLVEHLFLEMNNDPNGASLVSWREKDF